MTRENDPIPLDISGGAGGTQAITTDLTAAATILDRCAAHIEECAVELTTAHNLLYTARAQATGAPADDVSRATDAVEASRFGVDSTNLLAAAVEQCGEDLRTVAEQYENAESEASQSVSAGSSFGRFLTSVADFATWNTRLAAGIGWKMSPIGLATAPVGKDVVGDYVMPDGLPSMTGVITGERVASGLGTLRSPVVGPPVHLADPLTGQDGVYGAGASVLTGALGAAEWVAGEPRVTGVERVETSEVVAALDGFEDLAHNLHIVSTSPHGTIAYDVYGNGDEAVVVVYIPGTEDNGFSDGNPFDWHGNGEQITMDGGDAIADLNDSGQFVAQTLLGADIPEGASVVLVGHSQGGGIAESLAACEEVTDQLHITDVATFGSSTALEEADGVQYLSVANVTDPVPGLDGQKDTPSTNRITVQADLAGSDNPDAVAASKGLISSHALGTYALVGASIDASRSGSLQAARERLVTSVAGKTATRTYAAPTFESAREPAPLPQAEPTPPGEARKP